MNKRKYLTILLLTLLLTGYVNNIYGQMYRPLLQVKAEDIYLTAGKENTISLELENRGDFKVFEVQGILSSQNLGITIVNKSHRIWNDIEEEEKVTWKPIIYVNPDVPLGTYSITLTLSYIKMFNTGAVLPELSNLQISLIVNKRIQSKLQYIPPKQDIYLTAGDYKRTQFEIINFSEKEITDLEVLISSSTPYINIIEGLTYERDRLDVGDSIQINPLLYIGENTLQGEYLLTVIAYYHDNDGSNYQQVFHVPMTLETVRPPEITQITIHNIETEPNQIKPGNIFTLDLEIEAKGAVAYDVTSNLSLGTQSPLSPLTPTIVRLGQLEPNDKEISSYTLMVDGAVAAGQYPLTVTITFIDSKGRASSTTEMVTVLVEGIIDFELLNNDVVELVQGETSEIQMDLLLMGTENVRFVDVELISDTVFKTVPGSKEYIGAVDLDSPIPLQINVYVEETAPVGYNEITLKVTYTDHLNQKLEDVVHLSVNLVEPIGEEEAPQGLMAFWLWLRWIFGISP